MIRQPPRSTLLPNTTLFRSYKSRNERFLNAAVLGNHNERATKKNQEFQALLVALNAPHGLRPHNRVFYYDPMYKYFLPIYYDGDSNILSNKAFTPSNQIGRAHV